MAFPGQLSEIEEVDKLKHFMGDCQVTNIHNLAVSKKNGGFVVVAWLESVVEGVDLWFKDEDSKAVPKYRMKIRVKDGEDEIVFTLFDEDVEKLTVLTCPMLASMGEPCSIYPCELEVIYGEPILFNVEKFCDKETDGATLFKVKSICNQIGQLDLFFDRYLPDFHNKVFSSTITLLPDLDETADLFEACDVKEGNKETDGVIPLEVDSLVVVKPENLKRKVEEIAAEVEEFRKKKVVRG